MLKRNGSATTSPPGLVERHYRDETRVAGKSKTQTAERSEGVREECDGETH